MQQKNRQQKSRGPSGPSGGNAGAGRDHASGERLNSSPGREGGPGPDDDRLIREKAPSLWAYLRRVGADTRSFLRHVVEEEGQPAYGRMRNAVATIRIAGGTVTCDNEDLAPSADELTAIEVELAKASWPRSINIKEVGVKDLARRIGGRPTLYVFKNETGSEVLFVQQRIFPKEGGKHDLPWSYWNDGQWRKMEPDGDLLPLFGLEQLARGGAVMIHEGAKAAAYLQWLTSDDSAAKKKLAEHPWGVELQHYCHSACNIDPLSRGIGVQN